MGKQYKPYAKPKTLDALTGRRPVGNEKHEAYAIARAQGLNKTSSARIAGFSEKGSAAAGYRLEKTQPEIIARIEWLKKSSSTSDKDLDEARRSMLERGGPALVTDVTATWLALEFQKNCDLARTLNQPKEANIALAYIAQLKMLMPSEIPFAQEKPGTSNARTNGASEEISEGDSLTEGVGDAAEYSDEAEETFGLVSPSEVEGNNGSN